MPCVHLPNACAHSFSGFRQLAPAPAAECVVVLRIEFVPLDHASALAHPQVRRASHTSSLSRSAMSAVMFAQSASACRCVFVSHSAFRSPRFPLPHIRVSLKRTRRSFAIDSPPGSSSPSRGLGLTTALPFPPPFTLFSQQQRHTRGPQGLLQGPKPTRLGLARRCQAQAHRFHRGQGQRRERRGSDKPSPFRCFQLQDRRRGYSGRGRGNSFVPPHEAKSQARGPNRRRVPPHRCSDEQLLELWDKQDVHLNAVQLRVPEPAPGADVQLWQRDHVRRQRLCRGSRCDANPWAGRQGVVPRNRRRGAPGAWRRFPNQRAPFPPRD